MTRDGLFGLIFFYFCISLQPAAGVSDDLILHYTFDEDVGTTAVDQSGYGNDGAIMNSHAYEDGIDGQGLKIFGNPSAVSSSGGHVLLPQIDFNSMDEVTVSLWVKEIEILHPHGERYITFGSSGHSSGPGEISISKNHVGEIRYICGENVSYNPLPSAAGQFVHYAMTYSSGYMNAYRNGVLLDTIPAVLNVPHPEYAALGRSWWDNGSSTSTRLTAVLDEVRVYDRALSAEEITELYCESGGDGLVAYYPFTGDAADESGNGYDGTVVGATLAGDRFGNPDSAFYFDGVNAQIALPKSGPLDVERTNAISQSFWFKTSSSSSQALLLSKKGVGNGTLRGISTEIFYGQIVFRMVHDAFVNSKMVVSGTTVINDGQWHHVAISYDGSSSASGVVMYLDGALEKVYISSDALTGTILNDDTPYIGSLADRKYYEGCLDEVRLYDRVFSAEEVLELYTEEDDEPAAPMLEIHTDVLTNVLVVAGETIMRTMTLTNAGNADLEFSFCGPLSEDDGLILHYTFDEDVGTTAVDQSGYGNDGTIMNSHTYEGGIDGQGLKIFGNPSAVSSSGGHVLLPQIDFNSMDEVTVSLWVKEIEILHPHGERYITFGSSGHSSGPGEISISKNHVGEIRYICGENVSYNPLPSAAGQFVHYAMTYSSGYMNAYRNGVLLDTIPAVLNVPHPEYAALGRSWWDNGSSTSTRLTAVLDEVRVYSRALSAEEIQELHAQSGDDGLVASYPFNGDAADESGNGYDGAVVGATLIADRFGNPDSAYYFDGIKDRIDLPSEVLNFERTDAYSKSFWIKTADTSKKNNILAKINSSLDARGINVVLADGLLRVHLSNHNTGGNKIAVYGTTVLSDDQWHHVAVTYDGSSTAAGVNLYVDGGPEPKTVVADSLTGTILNSQIPTIGSRNTAYGYYYQGVIDDVRIYDRVISDEEVAELFVEGDDGLVAYYPFGGNADDESGNGRDGTVIGATLTADRFGNADRAYHFDGLDDYIDLGLFDEGVKAVSMWVRQGLRDEFEFYFGHNTFRLYASILYNGRLSFGDGSPNTLFTTVSMDDYVGQWVHMVVVGDGASSKVYLNGVNVTESTGNIGPALSSIVNLGRWPGPSPSARHYMKGDIDDVRIYDRILSESEVLDLYAEIPEQDCMLPDWLMVEPDSGTIAPGEQINVTLTYSASNMVAGDYVEHLLQLFSNDPEYPAVNIPVSMWVIPSVPAMYAEPQCTVGKSNEVAWTMQDGPVEYWVEAEAVQHCAPSSCSESNAPDGWLNLNSYAENPGDWFKDSGWVDATSYWFTGLRLNNIYRYRVKASVDTAIGRLESDWSGWTASAQAPVIIDHNDDHVPGWWKRAYFGTEDNFIGALDSDGDQLCDYYEYISGSNPQDARSRFKIGKSKAHENGDFVVNWDSVDGRVYSVYWSPVVAGPYELLEANIPYPQNSYTDTVHRAKSGFYKIEVMLDY